MQIIFSDHFHTFLTEMSKVVEQCNNGYQESPGARHLTKKLDKF